MWKKINNFLQCADSLMVGGAMALPIAVALAIMFFIDGFLRKFWGQIFGLTGVAQYFTLPGTALVLTLLVVYLGGRVGKAHWFLRSFGRLVAKIPLIGGSYKKAIWLMYTRKGFLKPVWVYRHGLLEFDDAGNVVRILRGNRRRGFFLREIYDKNEDLPPALKRTCEILIPPSQIIGGEPELFPFQMVEVQIEPGFGAFTTVILTQGLEGYSEQQTLAWEKAREVLEFPKLPQEERKLLEGIGIVVQEQLGQPDRTNTA